MSQRGFVLNLHISKIRLKISSEMLTRLQEDLMLPLDEKDQEFNDDWIDLLFLAVDSCHDEISLFYWVR